MPCEAQYKDAVQLTLEQIDLIIRLTEKYSTDLRICTSADGNINLYLNGVSVGHNDLPFVCMCVCLYLLTFVLCPNDTLLSLRACVVFALDLFGEHIL